MPERLADVMREQWAIHRGQHDGCADLDHCDPNRDVLMTPRPWPKLNGAQVMALLFACGVLARVAWWLVTK